jgi:putative transposase
MALRKTILVTGEVYHILNRSVQRLPIFQGKRECNFFLEAMEYYLQVKPPVKLSLYKINKDKFNIRRDKDSLVRVIAYCLMPNHFHLILKQLTEEGIKKYIQRLTNSFAHYYAKKHESSGHIFEGNFRAIRVVDDEQLWHLSRYIHLNPVKGYLTEKPEDYPFSSYRIYLGEQKPGFVDVSLVMENFSSPTRYKVFVEDRKDYQRVLEEIKLFALE